MSSTRPITRAWECRSMMSSASQSIADKRTHQQRHAGYAGSPLRARKAVRALQPILAGEPLGDIELVGGEDVDPEEAVALEQRPGRGLPVDADDQRRRIHRKRRHRRDSHAGDVLAAPDRDHADAAGQMAHGAAKIERGNLAIDTDIADGGVHGSLTGQMLRPRTGAGRAGSSLPAPRDRPSRAGAVAGCRHRYRARCGRLR